MDHQHAGPRSGHHVVPVEVTGHFFAVVLVLYSFGLHRCLCRHNSEKQQNQVLVHFRFLLEWWSTGTEAAHEGYDSLGGLCQILRFRPPRRLARFKAMVAFVNPVHLDFI